MSRSVVAVAGLLLVPVSALADVPVQPFTEVYDDNAAAHMSCGFFGSNVVFGTEIRELDLATDMDDAQYDLLQDYVALGLANVTLGVDEYLDSLNSATASFNYTAVLYYNGAAVSTATRARSVSLGGSGAEYVRTRVVEWTLPTTLDISDRGLFSVEFETTNSAICLVRGSANQAHARARLTTVGGYSSAVMLAFDTP